jgi:hypothetical protein
MDDELEIAHRLLEGGYILDAELFRVAAEIKKSRERNEQMNKDEE